MLHGTYLYWKKKLFLVYPKFKFNWESCVSSGNRTWENVFCLLRTSVSPFGKWGCLAGWLLRILTAWLLQQSVLTHLIALGAWAPHPARGRPDTRSCFAGLWQGRESWSLWLWGDIWKPGCEASITLDPYSSPRTSHLEGEKRRSHSLWRWDHLIQLPLFRRGDWEKALVRADTALLETRLLTCPPGLL